MTHKALPLANKKHLAILRKGAVAWNKWRKENPNTFPDLRGADLHGAKLRVADLDGANLSDANLRGADLSEAALNVADLTRADLQGADLRAADLTGAHLGTANLSEANLSFVFLDAADLSGADLSSADLGAAFIRGADLTGADLSGVDFTDAQFTDSNLDNVSLVGTLFINVDLSGVQGLETAQHLGPSEISISTLYKSGGNIPEEFLRGCGIPDDLIFYARHQIGSAKAVQFYSAFISYSSKDQDFTQRLHADLRGKGVRVWFAAEDLKIGDKLRDTIDEAIRIYDKLMLVLSDNSINSAWVEHEIRGALAKERRENRPVLFPIRLDDSVFGTTEQWAHDIRRDRHIGDFRNWKNHDDYQKAFDRLLRDLQADSRQVGG